MMAFDQHQGIHDTIHVRRFTRLAPGVSVVQNTVGTCMFGGVFDDPRLLYDVDPLNVQRHSEKPVGPIVGRRGRHGPTLSLTPTHFLHGDFGGP